MSLHFNAIPKESSVANQEQILRALSLDKNARKLLRIHQWFWNPKVVEALKRMEVKLREEIPEAESAVLSAILNNKAYVKISIVESFRQMAKLMR